MSTIHIEANPIDVAKVVLMPGDPNRCKFIANTYLTDVKLINEVRGELAYTGFYKGKRITVFSSGMGIASMGIYSHELYNDYDVDVIIRIGTAGSYSPDLKLYDILLADSAFSETSFDESSINRSLDVATSSFELNSIISDTADRLGIELKTGRVHTTEAFYSIPNINKYKDLKGCVAVEMECFALFVNAKKFHKKAAALLTISDDKLNHEEISPEEREVKLNKMITLALESIISL